MPLSTASSIALSNATNAEIRFAARPKAPPLQRIRERVGRIEACRCGCFRNPCRGPRFRKKTTEHADCGHACNGERGEKLHRSRPNHRRTFRDPCTPSRASRRSGTRSSAPFPKDASRHRCPLERVSAHASECTFRLARCLAIAERGASWIALVAFCHCILVMFPNAQSHTRGE